MKVNFITLFQQFMVITHRMNKKLNYNATS